MPSTVNEIPMMVTVMRPHIGQTCCQWYRLPTLMAEAGAAGLHKHTRHPSTSETPCDYPYCCSYVWATGTQTCLVKNTIHPEASGYTRCVFFFLTLVARQLPLARTSLVSVELSSQPRLAFGIDDDSAIFGAAHSVLYSSPGHSHSTWECSTRHYAVITITNDSDCSCMMRFQLYPR